MSPLRTVSQKFSLLVKISSVIDGDLVNNLLLHKSGYYFVYIICFQTFSSSMLFLDGRKGIHPEENWALISWQW